MMDELAAPSAEPASGAAPAAPEDSLPPPASLTTIRVRGRRHAAQDKAFLDLNAGAMGAGAARPSGLAPARPGRGTVVELIAYWSHLHRGTALPSPVDLNYTAGASGWPNTVLLRFDPGPGETPEEAAPRAVRVTGTTPEAAPGRAIPLTPEVASWIVELAREALHCADVVREVEHFPDSSGWLEAVLLPLSMRGGIPDHALYHLRLA
jgi:hypothetical protein